MKTGPPRVTQSPPQMHSTSRKFDLLTTTDAGALPVANDCEAVHTGIRSAAAAI